MKLVEVMNFSSDPKLQSLERELRELKYRGGFSTGPIPQHYQAHVKRLQAAISARREELRNRLTQSDRESELRNLARTSVRPEETSAEQRARHNANIGDGIKAGNTIRSKFGGWSELANAIKQYVIQASNDGKERVTTDDIVQHFRFPSHRSVDRWLERPEFRSVAQMLGRYN